MPANGRGGPLKRVYGKCHRKLYRLIVFSSGKGEKVR